MHRDLPVRAEARDKGVKDADSDDILVLACPANCSVVALQVPALCEAGGGWASHPGPGLCQGAC